MGLLKNKTGHSNDRVSGFLVNDNVPYITFLQELPGLPGPQELPELHQELPVLHQGLPVRQVPPGLREPERAPLP